jgi:hypothetical protein
MAIELSQRKQLACKIVDLRKLRLPSRMRFGRSERPVPAEDVDSRLQLVKVKSWGQKQKRNNRLEERLKTYYREAEILASLSHASFILCQPSFTGADSHAAKYYWSREGVPHGQLHVSGNIY